MEFKFYIIDDRPEEFGGPEIILGIDKKSMGELFLRMYRGINLDSYSCQYYRLVNAKDMKAILAEIELIKEN